MVLAIRALGDGTTPGRPDPAAVLRITERVMREGDVRSGGGGADLGPEDALALLRAWLGAMDLGIDADRVGRWDRGVDLERFDPALRTVGLLPGDSVNVLYAGRLTKE